MPLTAPDLRKASYGTLTIKAVIHLNDSQVKYVTIHKVEDISRDDASALYGHFQRLNDSLHMSALFTEVTCLG